MQKFLILLLASTALVGMQHELHYDPEQGFQRENQPTFMKQICDGIQTYGGSIAEIACGFVCLNMTCDSCTLSNAMADAAFELATFSNGSEANEVVALAASLVPAIGCVACGTAACCCCAIGSYWLYAGSKKLHTKLKTD